MWFLSPLHGFLKKETLQNKSWKRTSLASEQIKRKYNHCLTGLSICQDGRPMLEWESHIVSFHQVQFEDCNSCLQLIPVSYEENTKDLFNVAHEHTHINVGGSILRALFQTQDQVTGNNQCYHRQKQNQTQHWDKHLFPFYVAVVWVQLGVNSFIHAGVYKVQSKFAHCCCM